MKLFVVMLLFFVLSTTASAVTISFIGPCSEDPLLTKEIKLSEQQTSIGAESIKVLDNNEITYTGSEAGFSSIFETPTGLDAIEVLSDTHLRAYGWCFSINGVSPDEYSDKVFLEDENDNIIWFYAFAQQIEGEWIKQCSAAYRVKPDFLCSN